MILSEFCEILAEIAPLGLAEDWDNVGLLVGDRQASLQRVMTCLTITPQVAQEAVEQRVDLIVTHHPLPFKPIGKITSDTTVGSLLLRLISRGIAIYSAHTAFDSAAGGINQMWADSLGLTDTSPMIAANAAADPSCLGSGRQGVLAQPLTLLELATRAGETCRARDVRIVGAASKIGRVAIACGSGGAFLQAAHAGGCHAMITGEATFHTCLEAEAMGIALVLVGHYASERFAMERMADDLRQRVATGDGECDIFASRTDIDPLRTVSIGSTKH